MKHSSGSKTSLFLIELIITIFFFSVASVVCVRLFLYSHRMSTEAYDRFFAIETSGSFQEIIYHIDEALNSIKEGTYGICKNCGGLIQKPRLQALPFAKNCIRCQALLERRQ